MMQILELRLGASSLGNGSSDVDRTQFAKKPGWCGLHYSVHYLPQPSAVLSFLLFHSFLLHLPFSSLSFNPSFVLAVAELFSQGRPPLLLQSHF